MSFSPLNHPEPVTVQRSILAQPRTLLIAAGLAGVMGAASVVMNVGDMGDSTPAMIRVALGVFGVAAAAMLVARPRIGWLLVLAWAVLQIPVIAWNIDGNAFEQVLTFPLAMSSSTTVNGDVTESSQFGVNVIGIVLAIFFSRWRNAWESQQR